jgi:hypothetical protein
MTNEELLKSLHSALAEFHDDIGFLLGTLEAKGKREEPQSPAVEPAEPSTKPTTIEDVRAALTKLAGAKGGAVVKKLLKDVFNVDKASDLDAKDFGQVVVLAEKEVG